MPSVSKAQQRFMGMVHAAQNGEKPASPEVAKVAKDMTDKDAKDFASTSHKGLPNHIKKEILNKLKTEYGLMNSKHLMPAAPAMGLDDEDEQYGETKIMKLKKIMEAADEINTAVIPAAIKIKFEKALELMNGKELSYNQKIKLLAKIIDGLGIDKMELGRISSKLKSNLD
jgi:hypothetical protein